MNAATIVQLLIIFGPTAIEWIQDLQKVWGQQALTAEQVNDFCNRAKKSYDSYIQDGKAQLVV